MATVDLDALRVAVHEQTEWRADESTAVLFFRLALDESRYGVVSIDFEGVVTYYIATRGRNEREPAPLSLVLPVLALIARHLGHGPAPLTDGERDAAAVKVAAVWDIDDGPGKLCYRSVDAVINALPERFFGPARREVAS